MLRGINRQAIFEDDADREKFLETLKSFKKISRYKIYAYCLMENHVHLLIEETQTCPCVFRVKPSPTHSPGLRSNWNCKVKNSTLAH
ncbi:MAG TPA: transposase [Syntrophomonas sp.]|nr:transposase [Syntrophomonas sp.]